MSANPLPEPENIDVPFGPLGWVTFARTYARRFDGENRQETFHETIDRVLLACESQLKVGFTSAEEATARHLFLNLKCSVAGRFLWQLGTQTVDRLGLMSLQNCAFTIVNHPIRPFTWAFDALMLGSGVGFNIQREHVHEIPKVKAVTIHRRDEKDADFIIPDSREGWVELLRRVLEAHFITGKSFDFSAICIRSKGAPIKGFGGVASGPEDLSKAMLQISKLLNTRAGKKLRPIDALDIMNIIGDMVVSGNVRRSSQIALGDHDDFSYLAAKRWDLGSIPNWRAMSNNSVICNDFESLPDKFWDGYNGNGEPYGLINLDLCRTNGRLGETINEPNLAGVNPCAEVLLQPYETCCLGEIFLPRIESLSELKTALTILYRICKHSLQLDCHMEETEAIVHKNNKIGISVTGYLQATEEQKAWLPEAYRFIRQLDTIYSKTIDAPRSIRLTSVKPSGTLSLLPGVTHGCHPGFSRYFIRRIRMAANSPLVGLCRKNGYPVEYVERNDGTPDRNTVVVSFPCSYPETTILAKDMTAIDQLEVIKRLQTDWSDNAVSCTVYYKKEELPEIKAWLSANYNKHVKTVSFLLHKEHGFKQAPYEEITEDEYNRMSKKVKPLSNMSFDHDDIEESLECRDGGACPVR